MYPTPAGERPIVDAIVSADGEFARGHRALQAERRGKRRRLWLAEPRGGGGEEEYGCDGCAHGDESEPPHLQKDAAVS
jgi:hypothetical protein